MKVKKSDVLDYLIIYWMILYVFIISWFAYIKQGAMIMICLIFVRLFLDFKRTAHLPAFYLGLLFCFVYPIWNYISLGGNLVFLASNMRTITTTTILLVYLSFMCRYRRDFITKFFKKKKFLFNVYMVLNVPILMLQLNGHTELSGRHPESLTNTFSADLVSGLFGYNGTGLLTMYFCFLMLYNFVQYKCEYIKQKQVFVLYNILLVGFVSFVAANSDNKALFVLAPLFLIVYLIVFKMNFYRNILQKIRSLFRYIIKGFCVFAIFIFGLQPAIGTLDLISDIIEKTQSGLINANAAYGSAERLGIIVYALNNPSIRWYGSGIAKHEWQELYGLGFAHFGISDFGSFLCLGGILFILLLICFLLAVYRTVFKDKIAGYTFFVLTIVVLIYTQPMTVVSLTCSWVFLVFTTVLGCESIKDGNEAV